MSGSGAGLSAKNAKFSVGSPCRSPCPAKVPRTCSPPLLSSRSECGLRPREDTAELPDIRASLAVAAVGPPRSVIRPEDERKEAERAEIRQQQAEAARVEAERVAAAKLEHAKERAEQRAGECHCGCCTACT